MQRDEVREVLRTIFEHETGDDLAALADDVVLAQEFDLDSVDMVGLIMQVERHFRVRLTYDDLVDVTTAGSLIDLVIAKINQAAMSPAGSAAATGNSATATASKLAA
jgi:acyl carrier protein